MSERIPHGRVRTYTVAFRCQDCHGAITCSDGVGMKPSVARAEFAWSVKWVSEFAKRHRCEKKRKRA